MRIGLSTSVIQRGRTGIAEYVFALLRAFEKCATDHHVVLFVLKADLPLFEFTRTKFQLVPVPECIRQPVRDIIWHQTELPRLVRKHQLDVLHVPSYRRLLWTRPCGLVATVHDLAMYHVEKKYDWKRMAYGRTLARWLARRQDEIIAISQDTARDLEVSWKMAPERITVIHHGMDHDRFSPTPGVAEADVRRQFGMDRPFFFYVARLEHPAKNHLRLIQAFEDFKAQTRLPWQLVLAGSDWHGAEVIHRAIEQSPFSRDIRCLGFVPEEALPALYRAAGLFVYPSLYEGFGLPPLEAMACGCPVLCSTRGALGEVVSNAAATVEPENVAALTFQLARLAANEPLREQLRAAGLERARQFDWQRTATATLEVYARAAARAKARAVASCCALPPAAIASSRRIS